MKKSVQFGSEVIEYDLIFANRKTLGITVRPDRSVLVKAPEGSSLQKVDEKLRKKAPWILRQKQHFLSFEPRITQRKYVSGEEVLYLGRQYQLQLVKANKEGVKYEGKFIKVYTHDFDKDNVKRILDAWYRDKAEKWFFQLAKPWVNKFETFNVSPKNIELKNMKYRWGSCSAKGRVLLNPELIKAPKPCIEYVIVHELCHLVHYGHTKDFFDLQNKVMPDWEKWKDKLENLLA